MASRNCGCSLFWRGTQLVNALAGGDAFTAARAWLRFSGRLTRREPVAEALLQLFYSGDLDLVGVRDNDLVWVATTTSGDSN